jgi:AraC family transcriptional regulator of adaptative response/methylated-DNA-[protein]-cysteine methyltransferase
MISIDAAYAASERRDATYDGAFVLAVATTGIYCKPSCPARMPKRENVRLFAGGDEARAAGYRACKRCRPA